MDQWQREKMEAASLLSVQGLALVSELPEMLVMWFQKTLSDTKADPNELALRLMETLVDLGVTSVGNDMIALSAVRAAVRSANSRGDASSLKERYAHAAGECESVVLNNDECVNDIEHIDQLLLPALLGGETPISVSHARKVREVVLRDNEPEAIKLLRSFALKDSSRFCVRMSHGFYAGRMLERLQCSKPKQLYTAMKRMGAVGPAVYDSGAKVTLPRGFKRLSKPSLALRYARYLDERLEGEDED